MNLELSAAWGSSLPVSSQVSLKSEDLQEVHSCTTCTCSNMDRFNKTSLDDSAQILQEENEWCSLWCGKSFLVPTWIAKRKILLDCCAQKLQEERVRAILMREEFLCSNVVFYIKTSSWLFCTDVTREESLTREDFSNPSGEEERLFNNFNHNIWLLPILLFFGHVGRCGCFSGVLWWRSVHFCLNKCYKITSSSCVKLFMCII